MSAPAGLDFRLFPLRFTFQARAAIRFPDDGAANLLRGRFGATLRRVAGEAVYHRMFAPSAGAGGPSGLADHPRPFVFRAAHLDGRAFACGEKFHFEMNLFDMRSPDAAAPVVAAVSELARDGLGPRRGAADLLAVTGLEAPLVLPLDPVPHPVSRVLVRFLTPTELKGAGRPEFGVLAARIRDRLSTLRALYDRAPLPIDFRAFGDRASRVSMTRCALASLERSRRSRRTGQTHPLGGFVGEAEYEGALAEFLPYLLAAQWTGVGRQTVWGKGHLEVESR